MATYTVNFIAEFRGFEVEVEADSMEEAEGKVSEIPLSELAKVAGDDRSNGLSVDIEIWDEDDNLVYTGTQSW